MGAVTLLQVCLLCFCCVLSLPVHAAVGLRHVSFHENSVFSVPGGWELLQR
jgi:hypothetical protein